MRNSSSKLLSTLGSRVCPPTWTPQSLSGSWLPTSSGCQSFAAQPVPRAAYGVSHSNKHPYDKTPGVSDLVRARSLQPTTPPVGTTQDPSRADDYISTQEHHTHAQAAPHTQPTQSSAGHSSLDTQQSSGQFPVLPDVSHTQLQGHGGPGHASQSLSHSETSLTSDPPFHTQPLASHSAPTPHNTPTTVAPKATEPSASTSRPSAAEPTSSWYSPKSHPPSSSHTNTQPPIHHQSKMTAYANIKHKMDAYLYPFQRRARMELSKYVSSATSKQLDMLSQMLDWAKLITTDHIGALRSKTVQIYNQCQSWTRNTNQWTRQHANSMQQHTQQWMEQQRQRVAVWVLHMRQRWQQPSTNSSPSTDKHPHATPVQPQPIRTQGTTSVQVHPAQPMQPAPPAISTPYMSATPSPAAAPELHPVQQTTGQSSTLHNQTITDTVQQFIMEPTAGVVTTPADSTQSKLQQSDISSTTTTAAMSTSPVQSWQRPSSSALQLQGKLDAWLARNATLLKQESKVTAKLQNVIKSRNIKISIPQTHTPGLPEEKRASPTSQDMTSSTGPSSSSSTSSSVGNTLAQLLMRQRSPKTITDLSKVGVSAVRGDSQVTHQGVQLQPISPQQSDQTPSVASIAESVQVLHTPQHIPHPYEQELIRSIKDMEQHIQQLQAERTQVFTSASEGVNDHDNNEGKLQVITLDTPVFRIVAQLQTARTQLNQLQDELHAIQTGVWSPPDELQDVEPETQSSITSLAFDRQTSRQLTPAVEANQQLMDSLLSALRPAAHVTSSSSSSSRQERSRSVVTHHVSGDHQPSLGFEPVTRERTGVYNRSSPGSQSQNQSHADTTISSWVDDLRSMLGTSTTPSDTSADSQQHQSADISASELSSASQHDEQDDKPMSANLEPLDIPADVSVRELAGLLGTRPSRLEAWMRDTLAESPASIEDSVGADAAELAALEWGRTPIMTAWARDKQNHLPRPPVVTIMGHVDHGKTSLLDALRHSSVAKSEAGGITQHIGAFEVVLPGSPFPITFLDTPGHAAFSSMRARGAAVTDIVVLVVSADDGIMPQTREALAHARAANCPLVVALTKCDLHGARPAVVKRALLAEGVDLDEYGGSVQLVYTSAKTGEGLQDLTEALTLQAELMELKASPTCPGRGIVVESSQDRSGPQVTVIVKEGRLQVGDAVVVGTEFGRVRALRTSTGTAAPDGCIGPGQHALVMGVRGLPVPGDELKVVAGEEQARRISAARTARKDDYRRSQLMASLHTQMNKDVLKTAAAVAARRAAREDKLSAAARRRSATGAKLEQLAAGGVDTSSDAAGSSSDLSSTDASAMTTTHTGTSSTSSEEVVVVAPEKVELLRLVVKADVQGSVEAVLAMAQQLSSPYVNIKVLHAGVGPLTQGDINLAIAAGAHLVTFNLGSGLHGGVGGSMAAMESALNTARDVGVKLLSHNIVYSLMDELQALVKGATPYVDVEEVVGEGVVAATFPLSSRKDDKGPAGGRRIAGTRVTQGSLMKGSPYVRVVRNGVVVHQGTVTGLRRHKLDVDVVGSGTECGLVVDEGLWSDWQPGDVVQCVSTVRKRADAAERQQ